MKSIALVSYDYPPNDGGISRLCSAVATELSSRGRSVSVITLRPQASGGLLRPEVPTVAVPHKRLLREAAVFLQLMRTGRDVCVLSSIWNPEATLAWLALRKNSVVMAHGNEVMPYPSGMRYRFKGWLRRKVLTAARVVVCNSRYTEGLVHAISPEINTVVITPGVDTSRFSLAENTSALRQQFQLPNDRRIILSVSRMDAYKGHDVVLKALAGMPPELRSKLHYVVAGRGSHLAALKALATALGLDGTVTWLGFVADEALPALYGCADVFVLCTREDPQARGVEGFGMVFLEAQAAGVPVIGTRAGGIPDAIEQGQGGWLIEQDDVNALQAHLQGLSSDASPFREQGLRGRQRALTKGTWSCYVTKLLREVDEKND